MLPHLPSVNKDVAGVPVQVPPPPAFRSVLLPVKSAWLGDYEHSGDGVTAAQKAGLLYEKKVHIELNKKFSCFYHGSQVIFFEDGRGAGVCVPDGLIFFGEKVVVVEVKSQHVPESWWQLRKKYQPVVSVLFAGTRPILLLEICRSLDKDMPYPEKYDLVEDLEEWISSAPANSLGVLRWKL